MTWGRYEGAPKEQHDDLALRERTPKAPFSIDSYALRRTLITGYIADGEFKAWNVEHSRHIILTTVEPSSQESRTLQDCKSNVRGYRRDVLQSQHFCSYIGVVPSEDMELSMPKFFNLSMWDLISKF